MTIRIVTDSNCDLPPPLIQRYGITVVPFYINIGARSYLDSVEMSHSEFYAGLPRFEVQPMTSVPGPGAFVEIFERLAAEGASQVLSIHIDTNLSAMLNSARLAAESTTAVPVTVVDSGNLTLGTGLQVLAAARAAAAGQSVPDIVARLQNMAARTYCFAVLDTLVYLRRSGRLSHFQWGLGSVLRIKPILKMNNGTVEMERVRSAGKAQERLIELLQALGPLEDLSLVHTHAPERAEALGQQVSHLFPPGVDRLMAEVTPVIGAHIGPGAVGFVAVRAGNGSDLS